MVHWSGKGKDSPSVERARQRAVKEAWERRRRQRRRQIIKDKLDLYGEDSLNAEEREIVRLFHDYFYPEEG